ncbi:MAG: SDR family NAD(P)-dependent oxidoreductase [Deltaproteobacteria bacterium]|nr:SDR family NAD(P)-dependent oxidoreductase [Deltaproteobacteria bacterium]
MSKWTEAHVADQRGRVALVTGANSGIGWETARVLANAGARVVVACRSSERGHDAVRRLEETSPRGGIEFLQLDLADLDSVRAAVDSFAHDRLDLLINNAGLMATPLQRTSQGFEMQFGVNHLGHFALTGLLMPRLLSTSGSRIVSVSSTGHRPGHIRFDDLNWESEYRPWAAYFQSKLANLLFTFELQRRLEAAASETTAFASHPGGSKTNLGHENPGGFLNTLLSASRPLLERFLLQSSAMGALPTLRAAVDPEARGGEYYGPDGFNEQTGHPIRVDSSARSKDRDVAQRLWRESEELTGIKYEFSEC